MRTLLQITFILFLSSCSPKKQETACSREILDLTIRSYDEQPNKIIEYFSTKDFITITDSVDFLRYVDSESAETYLKALQTDSSKKEFTYHVKEGIIKTKNYQLDLIWVSNNSENGKNAYSWLSSYDNQRNKVGHLDFASWSEQEKSFSSGKIDCDTILHLFIPRNNEHRQFKINEMGNIIFIKPSKIN